MAEWYADKATAEWALAEFLQGTLPPFLGEGIQVRPVIRGGVLTGWEIRSTIEKPMTGEGAEPSAPIQPS